MQAIPSLIPLSRTASMTSSVMSRTASPPAVRSSVSRWKTFTAPYPSSLRRATTRPILRVPAAYVTGEPSIPRHAARRRLALGIGRGAAAGGPADADRPGHALGLVAVHGAVHLVALARREAELDRRARARLDVAALDLVALVAALLDRERV